MNYSLLKSWIGTDKAQTQKHKKMAQMVPCRDYGQAQRRAHNLLELRGQIYGTSKEVVQMNVTWLGVRLKLQNQCIQNLLLV